MDMFEVVRYPVFFPVCGQDLHFDPSQIVEPMDIRFHLRNYRRIVENEETLYWTYVYSCYSCLFHTGQDFLTEEFKRSKNILPEIEDQMQEHARQHCQLGAWGISVYRNMKEKK